MTEAGWFHGYGRLTILGALILALGTIILAGILTPRATALTRDGAIEVVSRSHRGTIRDARVGRCEQMFGNGQVPPTCDGQDVWVIRLSGECGQETHTEVVLERDTGKLIYRDYCGVHN